MHCLPVPKSLSLLEAGGLAECSFTVWTNVFDRGQLKAGERFLVHGGASGIGTFAIQLAKAMGATVFTTVGSADKAIFCKSIGADFAYNYREQDWEQLAAADGGNPLSGGGINVILDMVGGDYVEKNIRLLGLDGRLVFIAFLRGGKVDSMDLRPVMMKRLTVTGSTLRPRTDVEKAHICDSVRNTVLTFIESGQIKIVIHKVFDLADVRLAHELMESNEHIGKIMLKVAD